MGIQDGMSNLELKRTLRSLGGGGGVNPTLGKNNTCAV